MGCGAAHGQAFVWRVRHWQCACACACACPAEVLCLHARHHARPRVQVLVHIHAHTCTCTLRHLSKGGSGRASCGAEEGTRQVSRPLTFPLPQASCKLHAASFMPQALLLALGLLPGPCAWLCRAAWATNGLACVARPCAPAG